MATPIQSHVGGGGGGLPPKSMGRPPPPVNRETENIPSLILRVWAVIITYLFVCNEPPTKVKRNLPLKTNCESGLKEASSGKPL